MMRLTLGFEVFWGFVGVFLFGFWFFWFLGPHLWHMEVPRLVVKLKLQAYTTPDPSHVFNLHHSSQQCWILNPLREARDRTCILMDTSWARYH